MLTWRDVEILASAAKVKQNGWARVNCPECLVRLGVNDHSGALGWNPQEGRFSCFRCGAWGQDPARREWEDHDTPRAAIDAAARPRCSPPPDFISLAHGDGVTAHVTKPYRRYLTKRGVEQDAVEALNIGCCLSGQYGNRVIVPTLDPGTNKWLGFVARAISPENPVRVKASDGEWARNCLFNESATTATTAEPLYVTEGVFDCLTYLWPNAVALFGKIPKGSQLEMLRSTKRPIVFAYDGDAWEEAWGLALQFSIMGHDASYIRLPPGRDPADFDCRMLEHIRVF